MARTEKFEAVRPDGEVVIVTRNVDTGEQSVTPKGDAADDPKSAGGDLAEPKGNASLEAWAAWADHLEVAYPEDAKRDDIKALVAGSTPKGDAADDEGTW
ncbi:hypothetical protein GCM10025865_01170 [Paraoerskovia sediminicola]|uniref:Tail assembly chaperone n=1 Tax=Paraoerskovia sediminicola TaxID=1138587 RepID=A0ABM8FYJ1_9CELL|nr:hypothetical protein [Paraoerskovia sediminicola]BDZ40818.1 hypothetical protein GCM10025865_01170 [Paraoerskovia sediminicola]